MKQIKSFKLEVKDLNDSTGEITFQFGAFSKDLDQEIIDGESAYKKTIQENQANFYHNRDHTDAVGKPMKVFTDSKGAYCVSKLALKTIVGNDCYEQYKAGLIKGHSQEFETTKEDYSVTYKARVIKELRLWGVTSVTNIPANLDTPTLSIKSASDAAFQMKKINDLLTNGNISDKLGENFLSEYKKLDEFVKKNKMMAQIGILHCDNCKTIINEDDYEDGQEFRSCPECGRYINKTGKIKPTPSGIITADFVKGFKL